MLNAHINRTLTNLKLIQKLLVKENTAEGTKAEIGCLGYTTLTMKPKTA